MMKTAITIFALCGITACSPVPPASSRYHGQVFVALQSRETIKLSLVPVLLLESNAARVHMESVAEDLHRQARAILDIGLMAEKEVKDNEDQIQLLESKERDEKLEIEDAEKRMIAIRSDAFRLKGSITSAQLETARATIERLQAKVAEHKNNLASFEQRRRSATTRKEAATIRATNAAERGRALKTTAAEEIWKSKWPAVAETVTDADGKFEFHAPPGSNYVLAAFVRRKLFGDREEQMLWVVRPEDGQQTLLHNDNQLQGEILLFGKRRN